MIKWSYLLSALKLTVSFPVFVSCQSISKYLFSYLAFYYDDYFAQMNLLSFNCTYLMFFFCFHDHDLKLLLKLGLFFEVRTDIVILTFMSTIVIALLL